MAARKPGSGLAVLFTLTAFAGAALLFTVQPLVARLLLPAYGGSATVWSTCSLFFQVLLLVGYVYSHVATTRMPRRRQARFHLVVLALPLVALPLALPLDAAPSLESSPALWLLRSLALMIGLPFVVLSATGPLLQRWYSWSDGPRSDDPYFLFAASNVGSFGGLLAYPFLLEPRLTLDQQTQAFTWGFIGFAALTAACGLLSTRDTGRPDGFTKPMIPTVGPSRRRLALWCGYAFVPSCLMLAVTRHLSTDVAPIPLLWVLPLAIYLATFVAAFAVRSRTVSPVWPRLAAGLGMAGIAIAPLAVGLPLAVTMTLDLSLVAVAGYAAHRLLAADRPHPEHLTTFYLAVAVGGALGGLVNGLLAPVAFDRVLEYPLILAVLPLLGLALAGQRGRTAAWLETRTGQLVYLAVGLTLIASAAAILILASRGGNAALAAIGVPMLVCFGYALSRVPGALTVVLVGAVVVGAIWGDRGVTLRERTFYGSYTVRVDDAVSRLSHGTTLHGLQIRSAEGRDQPTTYYGREAPLGDLMGAVDTTHTLAVGLGVGTVAAYGESGDEITFLEIDPVVADLAADDRYFTFLADSAATVDVRIGDGRLLAEKMPDGETDLVVLDAFSSDSIPVHLLTREAFEGYAAKVTEGGTIAVHVSNRYFDLIPVVAAAADGLGWTGAVGVAGAGPYVTPSAWVVISPDRAVVDRMLEGERWRPLDLEHTVAWTDDYSSVLTVLR